MNSRVVMITTLYFLITTALVYLVILVLNYPLPNPAFIFGGLIGTGGGLMTWFNDVSPRQQRLALPFNDKVQLGALLAFLTILVASVGQFTIQWMPDPQRVIPFTAAMNFCFPLVLGNLFWQAFSQKRLTDADNKAKRNEALRKSAKKR